MTLNYVLSCIGDRKGSPRTNSQYLNEIVVPIDRTILVSSNNGIPLNANSLLILAVDTDEKRCRSAKVKVDAIFL